MTKGTKDSSKTMEKYVDTLVLAIPGFSNKLWELVTASSSFHYIEEKKIIWIMEFLLEVFV